VEPPCYNVDPVVQLRAGPIEQFVQTTPVELHLTIPDPTISVS